MLWFFIIEKVKWPQKHAEKLWKFKTRMLCSGNQDVNLGKNASRLGRAITEKVGEILQLVEQDRHASCQEIAEALYDCLESFEKSKLQKEA